MNEFVMVGMTSWLFRYKGGKKGGGSSVAPMEPTAPVPTIVPLDEGAKSREQARRRQRIAQAGRGGTILTEGQPLTSAGHATLLGRSV
jgi:hypothetical protein